MSDEESDLHRLYAVEGFAELEMWQQAGDELDQLDASLQDDPDVLGVRLQIYKALEKWALMEAVARKLLELNPSNSEAVYCFATATRILKGYSAALDVLERIVSKAPQRAPIHYLLAVYKVETGDFSGAKQHLRDAFNLNPALRAKALNDPEMAQVCDYMDEA